MWGFESYYEWDFFVMFTCSVFIVAAGLAAFKWNRAWHSSEVICNRCIEKKKDNLKNGGEVKRLNECVLALNKLFVWYRIVLCGITLSSLVRKISRLYHVYIIATNRHWIILYRKITDTTDYEPNPNIRKWNQKILAIDSPSKSCLSIVLQEQLDFSR